MVDAATAATRVRPQTAAEAASRAAEMAFEAARVAEREETTARFAQGSRMSGRRSRTNSSTRDLGGGP